MDHQEKQKHIKRCRFSFPHYEKGRIANPDTGILTNSTMQNPGIFVPELRKIVYGCGSWWREIKSVDELEAITNEDIENTWYVQLLQDV